MSVAAIPGCVCIAISLVDLLTRRVHTCLPGWLVESMKELNEFDSHTAVMVMKEGRKELGEGERGRLRQIDTPTDRPTDRPTSDRETETYTHVHTYEA